jgi:CheY-like chemotaxis protein
MNLEDIRVLVVDDEAALRGIFAKWLTKSGCRAVRTSANGAEAIEAIRQEPIDVLITDVRMPVMDGVTLVRRLAEQDPRVPTIIFVSGFGDVDRREMYHLGVEVFLTKPFSIDDLAAAIERATADPRLLWRTPLQSPPRQTVNLELPGPARSETNASEASQSGQDLGPDLGPGIGRGGFSARASEPLALGAVNFQCRFPEGTEDGEGAPELRGHGYVRWRSRLDQAVGIEFAYLESPGREWVVERIAVDNPRPFIPALAPDRDST